MHVPPRDKKSIQVHYIVVPQCRANRYRLAYFAFCQMLLISVCIAHFCKTQDSLSLKRKSAKFSSIHLNCKTRIPLSAFLANHSNYNYGIRRLSSCLCFSVESEICIMLHSLKCIWLQNNIFIKLRAICVIHRGQGPLQ